MRNIITPAVLSTMIPQEFEDWRDVSEVNRVRHCQNPCASSRASNSSAQRVYQALTVSGD